MTLNGGQSFGPVHNGYPVFSRLPWSRFADFTRCGQRFDVLKSILDQLKFNYSIVPLGKNRHFIVSPEQKTPAKCIFVAHYDAVPDCEGANDNGSGVFLLLSAAIKLNTDRFPSKSWLIIFTDKEELSQGESIRAQGSFLLANALRKTGNAAAEFYIFDACGRGGTVIVSTIADYLIKNENSNGAAHLQKKFRTLRNNVINCAQRVSSNKILLMPTPFSDDAGFLRAGIAAQTITALPDTEAANFMQLSRINSLYIEGLVSNRLSSTINPALIPETWRLINSEKDKAGKLDFACLSSLLNIIYSLLA